MPFAGTAIGTLSRREPGDTSTSVHGLAQGESDASDKAQVDIRSISERLSAFAATVTYDAIPERVLDRAKHLILDAVGLAFASTRFDYARVSMAAINKIAGTGDSPIIGFQTRLPLRDAALTNGLLIHGLDYDDTHLAGIIHATASVLPATLAAATHARASGSDLLAAYVVGIECATRIAAAAKAEFHHVGFHPTGLVGGFGCALAAGRLLGLSSEQLTLAQGIALSFASGCIEFVADGAWTKRLHPGHAAACGITAAAFAAENFTGPRLAYEGRHGLYNAYLGSRAEHVDLDLATRGLGREWELLDVAVKPYPACHFVHSAVDATLSLMREHNFGAGDVHQVSVGLPADVIPIVCEPEEAKRRPTNGYDAKFSIPYVVARALASGRLGIPDFDDDHISDPEVLALTDRVVHAADPESGFPRHYSANVVVRLADGRTVAHREQINRGSADRPLSGDDIVAKFLDNATTAVSMQRADEIRDVILSLDALSDLSALERVLTA